MRHNDGHHIPSIVAATECAKHRAGSGEACWALGNNNTLPAICGKRVKTYGFVGQITSPSLGRFK